MIEPENYTAFCDVVLVAVADAQVHPTLGPLDLVELCKRNGIEAQPTWLQLVGPDLAKAGYGSFYSQWEGGQFLLNGIGLRRADELRQMKRVNFKRTKSTNWSKWGAVASFAAIPVAIILWWLT